MEKLEDNIRIVAYGDDNIISVGSELLGCVDQKSLTEAFARMGFTYVDESKEGVEYTYRSLGEITFLKRAFAKCENEDMYVAPLAIDTVTEMARWTKRSDKNNSIAIDNVEGALRELSLHPRKVWDKYAKKLIIASRDRLNHVPTIVDYETLRTLVRTSEELLI